MAVRTDPGLRAVERVRGVAEAERLRELQSALSNQQSHDDHVIALGLQVQRGADLEAAALAGGSPAAVMSLRASLALLNGTIQQARQQAADAAEATDVARSAWEEASSQLAAVEQLLERRAEERRRERLRHESREADDIAGQAWLRKASHA